MKRTILLLATLILASAPGDAATVRRLPVLSGDNIVSVVGTRAVLVKLPRRVALEYRLPHPSWFTSFSTTGSYAAFAIQEAKPRAGVRQLFYYMILAGNAGCPSAGSLAASLTTCKPQYTQSALIRNNSSSIASSLVLDPGDYLIYAMTDPGKRATVRFRLPGLKGRTLAQADRSVRMTFRQTAITEVQGTALLSGTFTGEVDGPGLIGGGLWSTGTLFKRQPAGTEGNIEANLFATQSCFRSGNDATNKAPCQPLIDDTWSADRLFEWPATRNVWSWTFTHAEAMAPGGRAGAFAFWLSFLRI